MKVDWDKVKQSVERGLHSAQKGEHGSVRVHCRSVERMLGGAKSGPAKEVLDHVHHASTSIEISRAVDLLQKAYDLTLKQATGV